MVENTRGFLTGALLERCVPYVLRVDFYESLLDDVDGKLLKTKGAIKQSNQILKEFGFSESQMTRIGHVSASLLK